MTLDRELESVAGTLHDSIEPILKQPARVEPAVKQLLPELCLVDERCLTNTGHIERHSLSAIRQGHYYVRFLDRSGRLVAVAGILPEGLPSTSGEQLWKTLKDSQGNRYDQLSLSLHTRDNRPWGYLQVGRSLKEFDDYLAAVKLILGLGLPIAMVLVGVSSWWLAGLAIQPLYQSYEQIQQFTADAAHELRTPLAAIRATVESVLRTPHLSDAEARDIFRTIGHQNQRLTQLVADLLLLARLERQPVPMRRELCCLDDIVGDLVEELEALAVSAKVTLMSEIRVRQPLNVMGDEEQLYRLVSNLMVNAIQHTPIGEKVRVVLDRSDHHALIQIQDTGIGIAPEEQARIFERFYRVSSARSRSTGGSGLGLAIARAIVQAHHGSLQVQSELGKGSTFTIRLPLEVTPSESIRSLHQ
jgi:two-component system OmpR family sensor kinase